MWVVIRKVGCMAKRSSGATREAERRARYLDRYRVAAASGGRVTTRDDRNDPLVVLAVVRQRLDALDAERASLLRERERVAARARAGGATWADVVAAAGVSRQAVERYGVAGSGGGLG